MRVLITILVVIAAVVLVGSFPRADRVYKISMRRFVNPGQRQHDHVKYKSEKIERVSLDGKRIEDAKEDLTAEMWGVREVLGISPNGNVQAFKFVVERFVIQKGGAPPYEAFRAGTVVRAMLNAQGKAIFESTGGLIQPDVLEVLKLVFPLHPDSVEVNSNVMFGTTEPRAVGSEWPVDKAALARFMKFNESEVSGTIRFPYAKDHEGKEHCVLQMDVVMTPTEAPNLPEPLKLTSMKIIGRGEILVPVDNKAIMPSEKESMFADLVAEGTAPKGKVILERTVRVVKESESRLSR